MSKKIVMILTFNLLMLFVAISVLIMEPSNVFFSNAQNNADELVPSNVADGLHVGEKTAVLTTRSVKPAAKSTIFPVTAGYSNYSFRLRGIIPTVGCSNFSMEKPIIQDPSQRQTLVGELSSRVESSILFEFSPLVDNHAKQMFSSKVLHESWFELHPFQVACLPVENDQLYCALRVWLHLDRFLGKDMSNIRNRFQDSFLYGLKLDKNLKFVPKSGSFVGIPTPIQDLAFTGPEDPRVFAINGSVFLNFILGHSYDNVKIPLRRQFVWNLEDSVMYNIHVNKFVMNEWEKNWTPLIVDDQLYFIYQFTPVLRVMRCQLQDTVDAPTADCSFIIGQPQFGAMTPTSGMLLRGGSPFVRYAESNYYLTVTHTVQGYDHGRMYAAQLVLLNQLSMKIVFISSPIFVDPQLMSSIRIIVDTVIKLPFIYARSVMVENPDSLVIAIGINDNVCFLARLKGVAEILRIAIEKDKKLQSVDDSTCEAAEKQQKREKRMEMLYGQMNEWLSLTNWQEITSRFAKPPTE